jgi:hypothetical protein
MSVEVYTTVGSVVASHQGRICRTGGSLRHLPSLKKVFKKAVGDLYKRRIITITDDGIKLTE